LILLVLALIAGLPIAVWLDLRNLTETSQLRQARDLNSVVSSVRAYYASAVLSRDDRKPGRVPDAATKR
jgi:adenylate cyclase